MSEEISINQNSNSEKIFKFPNEEIKSSFGNSFSNLEIPFSFKSNKITENKENDSNSLEKEQESLLLNSFISKIIINK